MPANVIDARLRFADRRSAHLLETEEVTNLSLQYLIGKFGEFWIHIIADLKGLTLEPTQTEAKEQ